MHIAVAPSGYNCAESTTTAPPTSYATKKKTFEEACLKYICLHILGCVAGASFIATIWRLIDPYYTIWFLLAMGLFAGPCLFWCCAQCRSNNTFAMLRDPVSNDAMMTLIDNMQTAQASINIHVRCWHTQRTTTGTGKKRRTKKTRVTTFRGDFPFTGVTVSDDSGAIDGLTNTECTQVLFTKEYRFGTPQTAASFGAQCERLEMEHKNRDDNIKVTCTFDVPGFRAKVLTMPDYQLQHKPMWAEAWLSRLACFCFCTGCMNTYIDMQCQEIKYKVAKTFTNGGVQVTLIQAPIPVSAFAVPIAPMPIQPQQMGYFPQQKMGYNPQGQVMGYNPAMAPQAPQQMGYHPQAQPMYAPQPQQPPQHMGYNPQTPPPPYPSLPVSNQAV